MNNSILGIALLLWSFQAQATTMVDSSTLAKAEIIMQQLSEEVRTNQVQNIRVESSRKLEELLEETLKKEGTFDYDFSKIEGVSILQAGENPTFRIFTWQLYLDENDYQYRGFIQKKDGQVFKLEDQSDMMGGVEFNTFKPDSWYGALYYNLHAFENDGQECYLLFGYDAYSFFSHRKVLDVLYFDAKGRPVFGKTVLEMKDGRAQLRQVKRMLLEYSSTVSVTLNYNEEQDIILYDHLIYGSPIRGERPTNVPDGSYCGMRLGKKGTWEYVDKVYKDDPNNILIDATSYSKMVNEEPKISRKKKKDIFGRSK